MTKSPDAFRTISEVADVLETPAHVLRFWESRFPQIRPVKRAGGRRYYRPADVALLTGIKRLLHDDGMTIRGVQKILREQGVRFVSGVPDDLPDEDGDAALVAALAQVSPPAVNSPRLPPAEAETAQIIALQTALRDTPRPDPVAAEPPLPQDDLAVDDLAEDMADLTADLTEDRSDPAPPPPVQVIHPPAPVVADLFSLLDPPAPQPEPEPEPDPVAEAPMTVWAEEDPAPPEEPAAPLLRITRIGQASPPEPAPVTLPEPADDAPDAPTLAQRLRALRAPDLSADDRQNLADLRDRAMALRARMAEAQGQGAGPAGLGRTPV